MSESASGSDNPDITGRKLTVDEISMVTTALADYSKEAKQLKQAANDTSIRKAREHDIQNRRLHRKKWARMLVLAIISDVRSRIQIDLINRLEIEMRYRAPAIGKPATPLEEAAPMREKITMEAAVDQSAQIGETIAAAINAALLKLPLDTALTDAIQGLKAEIRLLANRHTPNVFTGSVPESLLGDKGAASPANGNRIAPSLPSAEQNLIPTTEIEIPDLSHSATVSIGETVPFNNTVAL